MKLLKNILNPSLALGAVFFAVAGFWSPFASAAGENEKIRDFLSPRIIGETLYLHGRIDSHIYEFMAYERKGLGLVRRVELNSYGGNIEWALLIAEKIRALGVATALPKENVCASACVVLFAAGAERLAHSESWFGVHTARGGKGFIQGFQAKCFDEQSAFRPELEGCAEKMLTWKNDATKMTDRYFLQMEIFGVSTQLRSHYDAKPDIENWVEEFNILKRPDWVLPAAEALHYKLVTGVL